MNTLAGRQASEFDFDNPGLVSGITNLYCGPSFETATSRPPQDEV
jgi:hypothetical protein